MNKLTEG